MNLLSALYHEVMRGEASLSGTGVILGLALLIVLRTTLPVQHRDRLKFPVQLYVGYLVMLVLLAVIPREWGGHRYFSFLALFALITSMAKATFLIIVDAVLARRQTKPFPKIFRDLAQWTVYGVAILMTFSAAGVDPGSILTTSALLTAVIGFSLQETLGNLFAGLSLQAQEPFEVGDWIQINDDDQLAGRVLEINWRSTNILTGDELQVIVPNGVLAKSLIRNYTKPSPAARRSVRVQCSYDTPPEDVRNAILPVVREVQGVLTDPPPLVITESLGDSGINYWVRFFTDQFGKRHVIDGTVRERVWYALGRARISIPYPIRVSYVNNVDDAFKAKEEADRIAVHLHALGSVDLFSVIPAKQLRELAVRIHSRRYGVGERVIREDDEGDELFIVESGEVAVDVLRGGGQTVQVARMGPGAFFGEMSLMTGEKRSASVRALSPCVLVVVDKASFHAILDTAPDLPEKLSNLLVKRQKQLESTSSNHAADTGDIVEESDRLLKRIRGFFSLR